MIILSPFFAKEIFFLLIIVFKSIIFLDHFFDSFRFHNSYQVNNFLIKKEENFSQKRIAFF